MNVSTGDHDGHFVKHWSQPVDLCRRLAERRSVGASFCFVADDARVTGVPTPLPITDLVGTPRLAAAESPLCLPVHN